MWLIGGLLGIIAALLVGRALARARRDRDWGTVLAILAALLVLSLGLLAATGRLHWVAAVAAAFLPLLRRLPTLLQYLPLLRQLFANRRSGHAGAGNTQGSRQSGSNRSGEQRRQQPTGATMSPATAREILGLGSRPSKDEIIAAHRRLMQKVHPDHGGTSFLAQQLNAARQTLLDEIDGR